MRRKVAVIGAGISGIVSAHLLSRKHEVTLYEKNSYLGGHTNTIEISNGPDTGLAVDTGFIVCNPKNYPNFYKFLAELGVQLRNCEMSFGFYAPHQNFGYCGPSLKELLAHSANLLRPRFIRLIRDQRRFNAKALSDLAMGRIRTKTLGEYVTELGLSRNFIDDYLVPLAAAIWSSPDAQIQKFPALTFLTFFKNHGMLEFSKRPQWQTLLGGSHSYIKAFAQRFQGKIQLNCAIERIERSKNITIYAQAGHFNHDCVILATHADEALRLLAAPSTEEQALLGAWRYHQNKTVLHTDVSLLPARRSLWAAWNYRAASQVTDGVGITYYMNRLQGLKAKHDYFVTLNRSAEIDPRKVIYRTSYTHPEYSPESVSSQVALRALNGLNNTYYCGAYLGYGFHEDGVNSALEVCSRFGSTL